jgi:hypothetical protein
MKLMQATLACLLIHTLGLAQPPRIQLEEKRLLEGRLLVFIPKSFAPMSEDMLELKYPNERRPTLVFTNESGSVNVAVTHTNNRITPTEVPQLQKQMERLFRNLYPSATWFRNELTQIDGRQCFLFDFRTPAVDTEVRNIMLGTSLDGRLLIITFNATKGLEQSWIPVGNQIIQSVKIAN